MIVLNPPPPPAYLDVVTQTPDQRAVETALRIARVSFRCAETEDRATWQRLLDECGDPSATFILGRVDLIPIAVRAAATPDDLETVDGPMGVLDLAAMLSNIAHVIQ